jgi:serine phosphatase RsbU (regulator of sigma subunit)
MKPGATGVVHPIFFGDRLMGTLVLGRNLDRTPFTAGQLNVVGTFSDFLAIQFVNAEIQESLIHSRLNEREIEIARAIQQSLIRRELPAATGIELAGHCESARQVGGDFFDVIECGNDQLLLVVADVMGKGVPAAMFAAILRSLFRALPWGDFRPSQLLNQANRLLYNDLSAVDMFITVQVLHIDAIARRVRVANAGHCPALLSGLPGEEAQTLAPDGVPLGVLPDAEFSDQEVGLSPGARLLAYTDGLVETRNPAGELYGYERLNQWLVAAATEGLGVQQLKERLIGELSRFQESDLLQDDQTFLILAG